MILSSDKALRLGDFIALDFEQSIQAGQLKDLLQLFPDTRQYHRSAFVSQLAIQGDQLVQLIAANGFQIAKVDDHLASIVFGRQAGGLVKQLGVGIGAVQIKLPQVNSKRHVAAHAKLGSKSRLVLVMLTVPAAHLRRILAGGASVVPFSYRDYSASLIDSAKARDYLIFLVQSDWQNFHQRTPATARCAAIKHECLRTVQGTIMPWKLETIWTLKRHQIS